MKQVHLLSTLLTLLLGCSNVLNAGDNTCDGQTSIGNPYYCYTYGNCVWWAWKEAADNWAIQFPNWNNNASGWATDARNLGYYVSSTPALGTIGVNTTQSSGKGHVASVTGIANGRVYVTEMDYGDSQNPGEHSANYAINFFNAGYIYPPGPSVTSMYPNLVTWSYYNQTISVNGTHFTNPLTVLVTFPSGGQSTLSGSQISYGSSTFFTMQVTFAATGWWSFVVIDSNGERSSPYWVYVV